MVQDMCCPGSPRQHRTHAQLCSARLTPPKSTTDLRLSPPHTPAPPSASLSVIFHCTAQAPEEGWGSQHVIVRNDETNELLGCCPMYFKGHSQGEYVFDSSWANYSHMMGKRWAKWPLPICYLMMEFGECGALTQGDPLAPATASRIASSSGWAVNSHMVGKGWSGWGPLTQGQAPHKAPCRLCLCGACCLRHVLSVGPVYMVAQEAQGVCVCCNTTAVGWPALVHTVCARHCCMLPLAAVYWVKVGATASHSSC
jgi:hypothetical protein